MKALLRNAHATKELEQALGQQATIICVPLCSLEFDRVTIQPALVTTPGKVLVFALHYAGLQTSITNLGWQAG